jgi:CobQ/CobB/MinD/ParA nucleotide binding domain
MKQVHITLQGKGGIGKSYVTALVAQNLMDRGEEVICIDTDPINATLSSFKAFKAQRVDLLQDNRIKEGRFDEMMEQILNTDSHFVIDSGAASFIPLSNYLVQHDALGLIAEHGKQPIIHSVIAGGFALNNTISDFAQLAEQMPESAKIMVWLNEHFGKIEFDGKSFEQSKAYQKHKDRVTGLLRLPRQNEDTFGQTIEQLISERLTFTEALESDVFRIMSKQRITMYRRGIYDQLATVS